MKMSVSLSAAICLVLGSGCGQSANEAAPAAAGTAAESEVAAPNAVKLAEIAAGDHRTAEEMARDEFRHPVETLTFFGIEPNMTVVEVWPGGGWYTQIIAPFLKSGGGAYYAAGFLRDGASERVTASLDKFHSAYVDHPEVYGVVEMTVLGDGHAIGPEGGADLVLTFRNIHNWQMHESTEENFSAFYRALKPGGVLGVVEHRADGSEVQRDGTAGYVYTDDVKAMAAAAGFEFDRSSEINANPADTKDHPFGVWTLPPSRRTSETRGVEDPDFDRSQYDAIGESDRMTLMFRKPIAADGALLE